MNNKKKKFRIITISAVVYLVLIVALLARQKLMNINDSEQQSQTTQSTEEQGDQTVTETIDYDQLYQDAVSQIDYDLDSAAMPILKTDCVSIMKENALPALERMEQSDSEELMSQLQVLKKIETLGIDTTTFETPELNWKNQYNSVDQMFEEQQVFDNQVTFTGSTASALNQLIQSQDSAYITITSRNIVLDETIVLKSNIGIDANGVTFTAGSTTVDKAIRAENCTNIAINNFVLENGGYNYGIYIINSNLFTVENSTVSNSTYKGLVVMGTNTGFQIKNNIITENGNGAVFLNGNISDGIIEENDIVDNYGTRNLTAGLVLTSMEIEDYETAYNEFKDEYLYNLTDTPHDIVIYQNNIKHNNSSGIYSDGAYCIYILDNTIFQNDKEGMCLDYGTFGAYVSNNIVKENGGRRRQSDEDLEADFVTAFGRMEDGSSPAKLPGISIDNSAYNTIVNNNVTQNYGSGVKMVRSAYRNLIMSNSITDNNIGEGDEFHFFGVEVGHASTPDEPVKGLDFTPDYENIICRNTITGSHYSGVYIGEDSYCNDIFDNVIMNAEFFTFENLSNKFNSKLNNISNRPNAGM